MSHAARPSPSTDSPRLRRLDAYAAVLFDMDGTLVETEGLWFDAGRAVIEGLAVQVPNAALERMHGVDLDASLRLLADDYDVHLEREQFVNPLLDAVEATLRAARARDGAAEWLQAVEAAGLARAIVSNSPARIVDATLEPHDWAQHLALRVSVDDVARGKPAPDIYRLAARRLGVEPADCLVLEDSLVGARAAVAAGATCILATFGTLDPEEARRVTPFVVDDLVEALALVRPTGAATAKSLLPPLSPPRP
jgi:HAD superfamily hydrolase (TIGR01509 family)